MKSLMCLKRKKQQRGRDSKISEKKKIIDKSQMKKCHQNRIARECRSLQRIKNTRGNASELSDMMFSGFAAFPACDSQAKVPRPMSVNPFTVSAPPPFLFFCRQMTEAWSSDFRNDFSLSLQGNVYPSRATSRNPFI